MPRTQTDDILREIEECRSKAEGAYLELVKQRPETAFEPYYSIGDGDYRPIREAYCPRCWDLGIDYDEITTGIPGEPPFVVTGQTMLARALPKIIVSLQREDSNGVISHTDESHQDEVIGAASQSLYRWENGTKMYTGSGIAQRMRSNFLAKSGAIRSATGEPYSNCIQVVDKDGRETWKINVKMMSTAQYEQSGQTAASESSLPLAEHPMSCVMTKIVGPSCDVGSDPSTMSHQEPGIFTLAPVDLANSQCSRWAEVEGGSTGNAPTIETLENLVRYLTAEPDGTSSVDLDTVYTVPPWTEDGDVPEVTVADWCRLARDRVGSAFSQGAPSVNAMLSTQLSKNKHTVVSDFGQSSWNLEFKRKGSR